MSDVRVFHNIVSVSAARLREDILDSPNSFFPGFRNFLTSSSLYNSEEEEIAFFGHKGVLFLVKIMEKTSNLSIDQLIEDVISFGKRWERFQRHQTLTRPEGKEAFEVILLFSDADPLFMAKASYLHGFVMRVFLVKGIDDGVGNLSYLMEKIYPTIRDEEMVDAAVPPIGLAQDQAPWARKVKGGEPERMKENPHAMRPMAINGVDKQVEMSSKSSAGSEQNFFTKGSLSVEEERDFDTLHQKLSLKHKEA